MKKLLPLSWLLPAVIVLLSGCIKDKISRTYQIMQPVYESKAVVLSNINGSPARELSKPGKIFIRGNYLYINEVDKGVHIYDNSNPSNPRQVSFISIPGNLDVAVSGHYMYADMYSDLLTIDIGDPLNAKLVDTSVNVFADRYYQNGWFPNTDQVIVDWIVKDTTVTDDPQQWAMPDCLGCFAIPATDAAMGGGKANYVPGISGSMARFVVLDSYLYAVNSSSLYAYDISNEADPERKNETGVGWNIETIFPFGSKLFIGSRNGMFIYDVSEPSTPEQVGYFQHATACDPVITDGDYAYVTLRAGNACQGTLNQLDVINVKNLSQPYLIESYDMQSPQGLGKDGNTLFVCDGSDGIKVYDVQNTPNLGLIHQIKDVNAFDAIPWAGNLIVSAEDGIHQYDYSDLHNIKSLSTIHISDK
jgi:hypothetical protein